SIKNLREYTQIDRWFLYQIQDLVTIEKQISDCKHLQELSPSLLLEIKQPGFSDIQIAQLLRDCTEDEVYEYRMAKGIQRVYKMVDTCSAEFEAKTPYYYSSFEKKVLV